METQTSTPSVAAVVRKANRSAIHRRTGISLSGVSRILSGARTARVVNLRKIADELGVTMDDLYTYLRLRSKRRTSKIAA